MDFGRYTTPGAALAADLVNARRAGAPLDRPAGYSVDAPWTPGIAAWLAPVADRLRAAFATEDHDAAAAAVNRLLEDLPVVPRLSAHDGRPAHLHYAPADADPPTRLACNAVMAVAAIISEHGVHRLGLCAAPSCGAAFVDTSRNGRRRFCSSACANRTHVAAHRRRTGQRGPSQRGP
jgi:predicted RNA-binding Zn ribbon-like protein